MLPDQKKVPSTYNTQNLLQVVNKIIPKYLFLATISETLSTLL